MPIGETNSISRYRALALVWEGYASFGNIVLSVYTHILAKRSQNFRLADGLAADYSRQVGQHPATALAPPLGHKTPYPLKCILRIPSGWSLALIGNASGRTGGKGGRLGPRRFR